MEVREERVMGGLKYIFQIGRLDRGITRKINFLIESNEFSSTLSSLALKQHLCKDGASNAKVVLIYPVSLPFNSNLLKSQDIPEDLKTKLEDILATKGKNYFRNPKEFFKDYHPDSKKADDCFVIHSIGEFEKVRFEGYIDDIVLEMFIFMVSKYLQENIEEVYVDVSSGLNIYILALLEAVRQFYVFTRLFSWGEEKQVRFNVVYTDPIIGSSSSNYRVYTYDLSYKVFFSSPIKSEDITSIENGEFKFRVSREIAGENRKLKSKLNKYLDKFATCFSAIKNNASLVLYTFPFDNVQDASSVVKEVLGLAKEQLYKDMQVSPKLSLDSFLKFILSMGLYRGILNNLQRYNVSLKREVPIKEIKGSFPELYKIFELNLNNSFLINEIESIEKLKYQIKENWRSLYEIFKEGKENNSHISGEIKDRNFFAHSGFEKTMTEVRRCGEDIFVRYKDEYKQQIKDFLKRGF